MMDHKWRPSTSILSNDDAKAQEDSSLLSYMGLGPEAFAEDIPDEALLFAALQDSAWEQRVAAIKAIGRRQAKTLAEPLMEALKDEYAAVRSIAVKVLGELAVPVAIESLVCALQDPSWEVRAESAYALGKMGHRIPVVPLLQALYDHDVSVRAAALKALGQAGAQARVEHIVQVFLTDTSWEVRAVAALALGELKAKSQLKTLLAQMENEEDLVRQAIKVACEQICAPIDDTALRAALREQTLSNATASSTPAQPDNVEKNSPAPQPASPAPEKTQIYAPIGDTVSLTVLRNQTHPTAITSSIPAQSENAEKNPLAPLLASPVTEKTRKLPHLIHLSSDRHLGSYILGEKIGQGGVCSVFLARHQFTGQTFALKISEEKDVSKFFQREAQVLMQLNHPHIIRIYDANIEEGIAYLAMDYLPNGTLRKKCPQGSHLPAYEVMTYIKELTSALQYAHNHQIIHGDVKPENVLFGPKEEVVLCDFGIASHSHSSQSLSKIMGTPSYMAPEQFDGRLLEASDQYALALIAWELLSGKHASHTFSYLALTAEDFQKATAEALRQSLFFSTAEQVLCKALSKDPDQRFENVTAFMMALEAALQAEKGSVEKVLTGYGYSAPPASLYSVTPGLRGTSPDGVATLVKMPYQRNSQFKVMPTDWDKQQTKNMQWLLLLTIAIGELVILVGSIVAFLVTENLWLVGLLPVYSLLLYSIWRHTLPMDERRYQLEVLKLQGKISSSHCHEKMTTPSMAKHSTRVELHNDDAYSQQPH